MRVLWWVGWVEGGWASLRRVWVAASLAELVRELLQLQRVGGEMGLWASLRWASIPPSLVERLRVPLPSLAQLVPAQWTYSQTPQVRL